MQSVIIPNSVTSIDSWAFAFTDLSSVTVPSSVTMIGDSAFNGCDNLQSVSIPSSVTVIESNTFQNCHSLVGIILPYSIEVIANDAFADCTSLQSFVFPSSVQVIGNGALRHCRSLTSITLNSIDPPAGDDMFEDTNDCPIYVPEASVDRYRSTWTKYSGRIRPTGAVIPDDPGSIIVFKDENARMICVENWDMNGDGELSYAEAAAVSSIGQVFKGSDVLSFEEFKYFTGLVRLDDGAFAKSRIMYITLPDSLREIGNWAFSECDNLSGIVFPSSVEFFGSNIFESTRYLQSVYIMAENPPTLEDARLYYGIDCVVFVPDDCLDRYLNNNDWCMNHTILPISSADPSYVYRTDYGMVDRDEWED